MAYVLLFTYLLTEHVDLPIIGFSHNSATVAALVDEDTKATTPPITEQENVFSDEEVESVGKMFKNEENTDDDDDLPLSKVQNSCKYLYK